MPDLATAFPVILAAFLGSFVEAAETQQLARRDWLAGVASFKAVLREGIEVVFIVLAVASAREFLPVPHRSAIQPRTPTPRGPSRSCRCVGSRLHLAARACRSSPWVWNNRLID